VFGGMIFLSACLVAMAMGEAPRGKPAKEAADKSGPQMLELPVRVVDKQGKPVVKAKITPWALRSSQGHGWWGEKDDPAGVGPKEVFTDENGTAVVLYPKYRDLGEQVGTIGVSVYVDHPDYAYPPAEHIDVPLSENKPY